MAKPLHAREIVDRASAFGIGGRRFGPFARNDFVGFTMHQDHSHLMAWLFIAAMAAFISSLLFFLREVVLTVTSVRINPR